MEQGKIFAEGRRKEGFKTVRAGCGKIEFLSDSETLAYYSHTRKTPQNMLILENKDTFYSMRRHLLEGKRVLGSYYRNIDLWRRERDF